MLLDEVKVKGRTEDRQPVPNAIERSLYLRLPLHMIMIRSLVSTLFFAFALAALAQGTWTQVTSHPSQWYAQASFSVGGKGYVCTGYNASQNTARLWEYDPATDAWTEKATLPGGARQYASAFAIGDTGYVMCGWNNSTSTDYNDLWAYHPATDTWVQKASLPGPPRYAGVAFSIDGIGYYGTGAANATWYNDLYAFDPTTNTWEQKANFPGNGRRWAVGFAAEGKGYIGTGESSGVRYRDFYAYDPATNTWEQRAMLGNTNRRQAYAFTINDQGYVGGGVDFVENWNDFHRYDVAANAWVPVSSFPLAACKNGTCFSTGEEAFIVGGNGQAPVLSHTWRFSPAISTGLLNAFDHTHTPYPNPARDHLYIDLAQVQSYIVLDTVGAVVARGTAKRSVDVSALAPGLYTLRLGGATSPSTVRFVVER